MRAQLQTLKICGHYLLLWVFLMSLSGCGIYLIGQALKDDNNPQQYQEFTVDEAQSTGCVPDDELKSDRVVQEDEVTLKRHTQRVIRYGCDPDGSQSNTVIKSDSWEQVQKPNQNYSIFPENISESDVPYNNPWYREIRGNAYNRSTCSMDSNLDRLFKALITGGLTLYLEAIADFFGGQQGPAIKFQIDMADHFTDMKVREGLNTIDYEFTGPCLDNESEECEENDRKTLEKGTLRLHVNYDLKEKGDIDEILYIDDCKPNP